MRALCWHGKGDIRCDTVPDPNFPAGYTVFRPVPGGNITCPATGHCTTAILGGAPVFTNVTGAGTLESHGKSTDVAVFFTDRLWLTEQFSVIGSLRPGTTSVERRETFFSTSRWARAIPQSRIATVTPLPVRPAS